MTHLHSHQHSHMVHQRPRVLAPYAHLVNSPVASLDLGCPSALIPTYPTEHGDGSPLVVDGEVITSITTIPMQLRNDTYPTTAPVIEPKHNLLRRAIDDPYWILMTLTAAIGVSIIATVIYGAIQIILAVGAWLNANATTIGTIIALIILLMLCGGAKAAQCAGIHCGGCRR
jgi:hypothetical protein